MAKTLHNLPRADRLALMRILARTATREADNLSCIFSQPGDDELIELAKRQPDKIIRSTPPQPKPKVSIFATGDDILDLLGVGKPRPSAISVIGHSVPISEERANQGTKD